MRSKLRNLIELWADGGLLVHVTLTNGEEIIGRVEEIDSDELVIEPVDEEMRVLPLTWVSVTHVVTASYTDLLVDDILRPEAEDVDVSEAP